jgi:hypothetical protein
MEVATLHISCIYDTDVVEINLTSFLPSHSAQTHLWAVAFVCE